MEIMCRVDDANIEGFSGGAKDRIQSVCQEYVEGIIAEAKRIEQSDRIGNAEVEVIASHVDEARKNYRRAPTRSISRIILDVFVEFFLLILGVLFDKNDLLNNTGFMIFYIIFLLVTVILLIIKYSKGA